MRFPPRFWRIPIALALVALSLISLHSDVRAQLDPIPDPISFGPVRVGIQIVAVLPDTLDPRGRPRKARPNLLTHAGDGSGRIFINEMGGQIYVLQDGQLLPDPFLDLANVIGKGFRWRGLEIGWQSFALPSKFVFHALR